MLRVVETVCKMELNFPKGIASGSLEPSREKLGPLRQQ